MTTEKEKKATLKVTLDRLRRDQEQWAKLSLIPKAHKVAYSIAKYIKNVLEGHWQLIESERVALVKRFDLNIEGAKETVGADELAAKELAAKEAACNAAWIAYLAAEVEVSRVEYTMDELMSSIPEKTPDGKDVLLDERMILAVGDFFAKPAETPKKAAKK